MDTIVKLTVPDHIYRFYQQASQYIVNCTPEEIMSDALSAYAQLLSDDISKTRTLENNRTDST